ncbi:MAG: nucleotidyltransferase family protein [Candidatus Eremiobacteraeota bacterium]|nr:nucleotidyltransferase family protein [Candidatus Eremiobacteraeota bacterium]
MPHHAQFRAIILAAGSSRRMGAQKLLMKFRDRPLIDYAIDAAARWDPLVVAGTEVWRALAPRGDVKLVRNEEPQRGMSFSLKLADAAIPRDASLVLFLGDKPLVTAELASLVCESLANADVAYPVHLQRNEPGHPVVLGAAVRPLIATLPDGDTLHVLRSNPQLTRREVATTDCGAFVDIDSPNEWNRADMLRQARASTGSA